MRITLGQPISLCELSSAFAGSDTVIYGLATDSREVQTGDLFLAYDGKHRHGISFAEQAFASGAAAVLTEGASDGERILSVPSLNGCIASLAKRYLGSRRAKRIAVTGSVGKSTTVAAVSRLLSEAYRVHAPSGNYNTEIGLPLTVLSMPSDTDVLVLELGARHAGEIAYLSEMVRPEIGIITGIGSSHLETFGTREAILSAKTEITRGMSEQSLLLLNADDPRLMEYAGNAPCRAEAVSPLLSLYAPLFATMDRPLRYAAAFAARIAEHLGVSDQQIRQALPMLSHPPMRLQRIERGGILYLMDAYNASPESALAALEVFASYKTDERELFALFSDMLELGDAAPLLHRELGCAAAKTGLAHLFCYGELAAEIATGAIDGGMRKDQISLFSFGEERALTDALRARLQGGHALLLKGSRKARLECILDKLN